MLLRYLNQPHFEDFLVLDNEVRAAAAAAAGMFLNPVIFFVVGDCGTTQEKACTKVRHLPHPFSFFHRNCFSKPKFLGMVILNLAKMIMYNFHYDYMMKHFPTAQLCFTDTGQ